MFAEPEKETDSPARLSGGQGDGYGTERRGKRLYYGWVVVFSLSLIAFIVNGMRFSFGIFFKSLESEFELSRAATSGIMSLNMLLGCVFCIASGWSMDRYGPRLITILMGLITGISLLLVSQAHEVWHLYLSYGLLLALGTGGAYAVFVATASRWFTRTRGLAVAIVTSGFNIGLTVIAPVTAYLISAYGWRMSYIILGGAGLVVVIPLALLLRKPPSQSPLVMGNDGVSASTSGSKKLMSQEDRSPSVLQMAITRNFWLSLVFWFGLGFCAFLISTHLVPHALDLGFTATQAAVVLSTQGGLNVIGRFVLGRMSDSIGSKHTAMICLLVMGLAMVWLMWVSDLWGLYFFAVVFGLFSGGAGVTCVALATDVFGVSHLGAIISMLDGGHSLGAALGPLIGGYIFDIRGSYFLAFFIGALVFIMSTVLITTIKVPEKGART